MKKKTRNIIIFTIITLVLLLGIDTVQALLFSNSPIVRYHYVIKGNSDLKTIDKGLFVDTYYCKNGNIISVLKGF